MSATRKLLLAAAGFAALSLAAVPALAQDPPAPAPAPSPVKPSTTIGAGGDLDAWIEYWKARRPDDGEERCDADGRRSRFYYPENDGQSIGQELTDLESLVVPEGPEADALRDRIAALKAEREIQLDAWNEAGRPKCWRRRPPERTPRRGPPSPPAATPPPVVNEGPAPAPRPQRPTPYTHARDDQNLEDQRSHMARVARECDWAELNRLWAKYVESIKQLKAKYEAQLEAYPDLEPAERERLQERLDEMNRLLQVVDPPRTDVCPPTSVSGFDTGGMDYGFFLGVGSTSDFGPMTAGKREDSASHGSPVASAEIEETTFFSIEASHERYGFDLEWETGGTEHNFSAGAPTSPDNYGVPFLLEDSLAGTGLFVGDQWNVAAFASQDFDRYALGVEFHDLILRDLDRPGGPQLTVGVRVDISGLFEEGEAATLYTFPSSTFEVESNQSYEIDQYYLGISLTPAIVIMNETFNTFLEAQIGLAVQSSEGSIAQQVICDFCGPGFQFFDQRVDEDDTNLAVVLGLRVTLQRELTADVVAELSGSWNYVSERTVLDIPLIPQANHDFFPSEPGSTAGVRIGVRWRY